MSFNPPTIEFSKLATIVFLVPFRHEAANNFLTFLEKPADLKFKLRAAMPIVSEFRDLGDISLCLADLEREKEGDEKIFP